MYDEHDIFAVLTAHDTKNKASRAFKLWHNSAWFVPATGGVAEEATISSREVTPAQNPQLDDDVCAADRLVVTFSELMQLEDLSEGILAGTGASCHILLGHRGTRGISHKHYGIAVDENLRIWLHDHSLHGTAVGYQGQNEDEMRRKETWILAYEPGHDNPFGSITVNSGGLVVILEFPNHKAGNPSYVALLRALVDKCKADIPLVQELGLVSEASTQAPSGPQTLGERAIYYREKKIGNGQFAQVYKVVRARDGKVFAAKTFTPPTTRNKRRRGEVDPAWLMQIRHEFAIINENRHPNVVQVQVLDCLGYLHRRDVAHRDLKPENILVEFEPLYKVVVTDFGLSKVAAGDAWLKTFCGTLKYASPEVFPLNTAGHGPPADIWSLGVIGLEWVTGLPNPPEQPTAAPGADVPPRRWHTWVDDWVDRLLQRLYDEDDGQGDGRMFQILCRMLKREDRKRWHAMDCLALGFENGLFERREHDKLVAYKGGFQGVVLPALDQGDDESKTPTGASAPRPPHAKSNSKVSTAILGYTWDGGV
ncbi:Protein kinase-like domain protein [Niveomyces insectorum RCEF 264]|uniref:Protein kinase-like domain protein n=1 Tax=Niveomyces insectorum RCEF 264 TaxID=1081102 RepID=A0A167PTG6_9HYPO|nr:Protein kinase-like domain protein [Niveomyces insectorum RCEF 264]